VAEDMAAAIGPGRAGSGRWRALAALAREAWGLPRHLSQHPGGMVLSTRPLVDICPVQPAAMEGRQIAQWDKDSCADAGFLKIDLLGLGMLSAVERCVDEIARVRGERIDLSRIPMDDRETYQAIQRAETTGAFQIESRAQMQMLPRTHPESLDDLTVQVALVRPGPIQGGAVHPYLERKSRLRSDPGYEVPYEHPSLKPILSDTLGAIVFQEQVIQVAMTLAGFSAGEAEGLRRAMSRKRSEEAIMAYRERFVEGAVERGVDAAVAERVFQQVRGFSGFGFPKAHAAAFGLLAYQSTWLRVHYAPEFLCALLNEQPMGFYPPDALVHEAQRRGIRVHGPDVNRSAVECSVELPPAVRIGLGYVSGMREEEARGIVDERERGGPYADLADLTSRTTAGRDGLERLAWAGACASLGVTRGARTAGDGADPARPPDPPNGRRGDLWRVGVARAGRAEPQQLALPLPVPEPPHLRELDSWETVVADYASTGMTLGSHPLALMRPGLDPDLATSEALERLPDGSTVEVAGMVVARQRPATARGVVFMLLEDEFGVINLVVLPPAYERHRLAVRTAPFVWVRGKLERRDGVVNVVAASLEALAAPDIALAEVRPIEPPAGPETGRTPASEDADAALPRVAAAAGAGRRAGRPATDIAAVAPRPHSFGRRGR
jgi:error-prone DNA polymerase